jgi:transcriptional regulator with XRE-family HTH domain
METVGLRIRAVRKMSGLTLKQLAQKIHISPITLHRIETGKRSPSVAVLSEIAENLKN